jgi:CspA family cold shock protein
VSRTEEVLEGGGGLSLSVALLIRGLRELRQTERWISSRSKHERRSEMATGTVKWFNDAKGYGFITQDGGGDDVFCHHTAIQADGFRTLTEGQKVQFETSKGPKGLQAQNVRPI